MDHSVFCEKLIPKQVVSEIVYRTGLNNKKIKISSVLLYSETRKKQNYLLKTTTKEHNKNITEETNILIF